MACKVVDNQPHTSLDQILRVVSVHFPEVHPPAGTNETHEKMKPSLKELIRDFDLVSLIGLCVRKQALK